MYRLLFLFSFLPLLVSAQYSKLVKVNGYNIGVDVKGKEAVLAKKYSTCLYSHRYTVSQRRSFFPFNGASTVRLISFREDNIPYEPVAKSDFRIDESKVKESAVLTNSGIDSLTDVLYNVGYTPIKLPFKLIDSGHSCYSPRNAILFVDANSRVKEYIELCFSCERYFLSSFKIKNTEYCEQKYDLLKAFFLKQNIQYGTILPKTSDE